MSDTQLASGPFNQPRVPVSRIEAERILQQIEGPINGIERVSDAVLQGWLPRQYELRQVGSLY